jgi:LmbE family N-acetylglucosaminyl deacetylase
MIQHLDKISTGSIRRLDAPQSLPSSGAKGERRILAVSAHPDDVEFTSGGSLVQWAAEGWTTYLVVCTDGGKGSHNPNLDPRVLAARRRHEQEAAAKTLGVAEVTFLDHPDGTLAMQSGLTAELTRLIRRIHPDRLLCWDPWRRYELHPDHRAAGFATLDAVLAAGNPHYFTEQLVEGMEAHQVPEVYLFGAEEPDTWVDITEMFERKMAAIECHTSQVDNIRDVAQQMSQCALDYGEQSGATYAEAFKVLHPFCDA